MEQLLLFDKWWKYPPKFDAPMVVFRPHKRKRGRRKRKSDYRREVIRASTSNTSRARFASTSNQIESSKLRLSKEDKKKQRKLFVQGGLVNGR